MNLAEAQEVLVKFGFSPDVRIEKLHQVYAVYSEGKLLRVGADLTALVVAVTNEVISVALVDAAIARATGEAAADDPQWTNEQLAEITARAKAQVDVAAGVNPEMLGRSE